MKRAAMALMVFALGLSSFADVPWTDVETVTAYLTNMIPVAVSDVRVHTSDEAVPIIDRYFTSVPEYLKDCEGNCSLEPEIRLRRMKHMLENEFAFVYSFSTSVSNLEYAASGKVSGDVFVYVFQPRVFSWFDMHEHSQRALIGLRRTDPAECVVLSKTDGCAFECFISGIGNGKSEGQPLPFRNRKLETDIRVPTSDADDNDDEVEPEAVVVADVEGTFFDSVRNMNPSCVKGVTPTSYTLISPVATYRVELLVRRVEDGAFPYERLAFTVDPDRDRALYETWPFYRGMTLGVALCRIDGALCVRRVWPVLPYPPFTRSTEIFTDSPSVCRSMSMDSRFSLNKRAADLRPGEAAAGLAVQYGEHTLAKFIATRNGITGLYGDFPDYSSGIKVEVWTASEGANPDYWRDAWFASPGDRSPKPSDAGEFCTVQNAEEGLDDLTLLKFKWMPCRVDNRILKVKTFEDFAKYLDAAAVCAACGRRHYKVSVDSTVASRKVNFPHAFRNVFDALTDACERNGCEFKVDGTNVVVSAYLSDADLADDSLRGRLRVLEKVGFASVAGAQYADVSFWRGDTKSGTKSPVGELPFEFSIGDYVLTGDGWIRTTADGRRETLAFDCSWWPSDGSEGFHEPQKARLARDIAKVRAYLRDAAADSEDSGPRWDSEQYDRLALAFALHVYQAGYAEEAQSLCDALKLRPGAEPQAFNSLLSKIKRDRKEYPDFQTWLEKSVDPTKKGGSDDGE
jgi:hypothetical protein